MIRRVDFLSALAIGALAGLLMLAIGRTLALPSGLDAFLLWLPFVFPAATLSVMTAGAVASARFGFLYQLTKFALVGGLNFLIDLGVLTLLIAATGIASGFYADAFKGASFLVAMSSSFLWNKFWTFRALSTADAGKQFAGFFAVTLGGFFINVGVFALLNWLGPLGLPPPAWASIAAGGAAIAGLIWNFLGYKFFVFRRADA